MSGHSASAGPRICILDYGMGNLRSVEKALEHVGARASITSDPSRRDAADGLVLPGVGAFADGDRADPRARARPADRAATGGRDPGSRDLPRLSAAVRILDRARRRPRARPARGRGRRARRAGSEGAPHRLGAGRLGDRLAAAARGSTRARRSTSSTAFAPRWPSDAERRSRPPSTASASPARSRGHRSTASSSTPRSRAPRACACSPTSPASAPRVAGVILYPAIDIRDGHAVRLVQGDYERETVYDADPLDAARRWVDQGARGAARRRPRRGAGRARRSTSSTCARICAEVDVPVQAAAGCARRTTSTRCCEPAPRGRCSAPRRSPTRR